MSDLFKTKMELIVKQLAEAQALVSQLKPEFEEYIKNSAVSLDERWGVFKGAPKFLRNEEPWIQHLKVGTKEISWYDDFYYERHQDVDMVEVIESLEEQLDPTSYNHTDEFTQDDINNLKEDILSKNMGSFNLDW